MPQAWVIGLGKSGFAAAALLKARGWQVWASDRRAGQTSDQSSRELTERQQQLLSQQVEVTLGFDLILQGIDLSRPLPELIVVSPGINWHHPTLIQARQLQIQVWGEAELGWQYLKQLPWVGVTGTNGKTTTTAMIAQIFQEAGFLAPACGNIGLPISEVALQGHPDWVIAELSSYQIEASNICCEIGVWTTFTPDHLSRHGDLAGYSEIKASLLRSAAQRVVNRADPYLAANAERLLGENLVWTDTQAACNQGADISGGWVRFRSEPVLELAQFGLPGEHNLQNLLMAVAVARLAGIESKVIAEAIAKFRGVPHRLELVGCWQGLTFINDSKATNFDAAWVGLQAVNPPVILIAGGEDKAGDPAAWLELIQSKVTVVLLIGAASDRFGQMLDLVNFSSYWQVETLTAALDWVKLHAKPEATVLFSPACASFDQYDNFEQRGDHFRTLVLERFAPWN
ncbi:MAG: UDP-N-acetylmuramoyl-L-alanine--D-glutamate ligase [Pseudanabaenaceae cyanobacterium bins.68]|nr:UDP-N-acetylmuramoyl-L-alanine--D-glutamate ligase [Pseudanabaenaceae cyanobacterium bins.68]